MTDLTPAERDMLAMEYALGLAEDDGGRMDALLRDDPVFAARVAHWRSRFGTLDETAPELAPNEGLWARIEAGLSAAAETPPPRLAPAADSSPLSRLWQNAALWRRAAFASAAAAAMLLALMIVTAPSRPVLIAVLQAEDGKPGAIVEAFADGRVRLVPLERIDVPQGRALEVWTLRDRTEGPISVGLLDRARTMKLDLGKLPPPGTGQLFEITLEPATGSPTGRPTGPVLFKGLTKDTL